MASSDVDQRFLAAAAKRIASENPLASAAFYKILGNSVLLARKLYRARKLRKLDTSRDTKSLSLYQHIIWMSREGLELLDIYILPHVLDGHFDPEVRVLSVKLRASYHHIFCLFHNQPPVSQAGNPYYKPPLASPKTSPRSGNGKRGGNGKITSPTKTKGGLREPIDSITSETSFVTNPFSKSTTTVNKSPPGLAPPPGLSPVRIPQPSAFLLPVMNWLPLTSSYFVSASAYAQACLPGSHPLRLSVALEHSAFLWDCLHDHDGARTMARAAIKDVYRAPESMDDEEFQAAAELVSVLGRMMKRRSWEGTPRPGTSAGSPPPGIVPTTNGAPVQPSVTLTAPLSPETPTRSATQKDSPPRSRSGSSHKENKRGSTSSGNRGHLSKEHVPFGAPIPFSVQLSTSESRPQTRRSSAGAGAPPTSRTQRSKDSPSSAHNRRSQGSSRKSGGSNETTPRAGIVSSGTGNRTSYSSGGSTTPRAGSGAVQPASPHSSRRGADSPGRGALGRGGGQVMGR